jgi:phenylacetate-CoA ligase
MAIRKFSFIMGRGSYNPNTALNESETADRRGPMNTPAAQPSVLQRYAAGYWLYHRQLRHSQWRTPDELRAEQLQKLRALLVNVVEHVPYYRTLFRQLGATPDDFREMSDLARLPVLDKQTVREHPADFLNPHRDRRRVFADHTSGSTGEPLEFLLTAEQKAYEMAYSIRFWLWAGYRTGAPIIAFRSYIPATEHDPLWKYDPRQRTLLFSVYDMKPANLRNYVEQFNRFQPEFVRGYPSSIYIFAQFAASEGLKVHSPQAVLSSSETLSPEMRATIERVLQCPVFDWWGTNERVATACQCEQRGLLHINAETGILEFLPQQDATGATVYRIVGTGLINHAMPLIRYDLGDLAVPATNPCPCGRGLPAIERILGRANDLIVTGDQKFIPSVRFFTLFETYDTIRQFQVVQTAPNAVTVSLVRARELSDAELTGLRQKLSRFLGERVEIDIVFVDEIKPEPSGKIRNVVSLVKP